MGEDSIPAERRLLSEVLLEAAGGFVEARLMDTPARTLDAHVIATVHAGLELLW